MPTPNHAGRLLVHPKQVEWCVTFPEHQSHLHRRRYTRATWYPAQQQMSFGRRDELALTVQHHLHRRDPECIDFIEGISEWKRLRALPHNREAFAQFLEAAK